MKPILFLNIAWMKKYQDTGRHAQRDLFVYAEQARKGPCP